MSTIRTTMNADDAARALEVVAPVKKDFMARWGVSTAPLFFWRKNGVPSPTSTALVYARDRVRAVDASRIEAIRAAVGDEAFASAAERIEAAILAGDELPMSRGGDPMDGPAIDAGIEALGYSKTAFAEWIGTTRRTLDRWTQEPVDGKPVAGIDKGIAWMLRSMLADRGVSVDGRDPALEAVANFAVDAGLAGWEPAHVVGAIQQAREPAQRSEPAL